MSKPKLSSPEINSATKLQIITSHPKIASNNRRNPIFIKKPATAERLNNPNFRQNTFLPLFVELFRQIQ